ncbi:hypothetical protein KL86SPO_31241 [uncultured Sporomusa sp.]|uniref:CheW-like domain-containing protein n=1 Tax=uncultured Sporomusa sp. TaxID=307249 RepID=A0A212LU61_9FIRM|nr:hypothetical protein [uncultured Sporomusa sp.]SCM81062.1 hypothetical protein KL86SPO_31241 [uncultured Sporomusa sp.]
MKKVQLLIFKYGAAKYGVPVEYVKGIIGNTKLGKLSDLGRQSSLLIYVDGIQIAIIADEIIKISELEAKQPTSVTGQGNFQIWRL